MEKFGGYEIITYISPFGENRLHLRKTQINLVFRSVCTIFAAENK